MKIGNGNESGIEYAQTDDDDDDDVDYICLALCIISLRLSWACHLWYKMWQNHIDFSFGFAFISINLAPLWMSVDEMKRKARWCLI